MTQQSAIISSPQPRDDLWSGQLYFFIAFFLGLWSCLTIYNATIFSVNPFHFTGRQALWLLVGFTVMWMCSQFPFKSVFRHIPTITALGFFLLILVLIFGTRVNGMKGWFTFGSIFIQPSEFCKIPFILSLCLVAKKTTSSGKRLLFMISTIFLWTLPLTIEPDFGTTCIYLLGGLIVLWLSGIRLTHLGLIVLAMGACGSLACFVGGHHYILERLKGFLNPERYQATSGWHIMQFQYTIAQGGLTGTEWDNSLWSNAYLPLAHSDSSFASLTESVGVFGAAPVIICFLIMGYTSWRNAIKTENETARLFVGSMTFMIIAQALVHISVNLALLPPTGITLPLVSYGGSSVVSTMAALGLIISASKRETPH